MGVKILSGLMLLSMMCSLISSTVLQDPMDKGEDPVPLVNPLTRDGDQVKQNDDDDNVTTTTAAPSQANKVKDLVEAITLAVTTGICGPSLFALFGCFIRQVRITWDDPFAGGERPIDEAAVRRRRRTLRQQRESEVDGAELDNAYDVVPRRATNNFDPMLLDGVTTLDLNKIKAKPLPNAINNNAAGKINKGYSKTLEDIM